MSEEVSKYHVKSNNETDTPEFPESQIRSVAERSWWRKTPKKTLAKSNNLTEKDIDELRSQREYREYVKQIMFERRAKTLEDFEEWIESYYRKYGNMYEVFGEHMGLDPEVVQNIVEQVRQKLQDSEV